MGKQNSGQLVSFTSGTPLCKRKSKVIFHLESLKQTINTSFMPKCFRKVQDTKKGVVVVHESPKVGTLTKQIVAF